MPCSMRWYSTRQLCGVEDAGPLGRIGAAIPRLSKMSEMNCICDVIQSETVNHLNKLIDEFHCWFCDFEHDTPLMIFPKNPFRFPAERYPRTEFGVDLSARDYFEDSTLDKF